MAESQVQYQYISAEKLKLSLSADRFQPFLQRGGFNEEYAFNLYLYNARLAKSFLYPLHILEVTLRNKISEIFTLLYGIEWPKDESFKQQLTQESLDALVKGIQRSKSDSTKNIVATLTFDFWSNLFRSDYDRSFWQSNMHLLLPNTIKSRHEFQQIVKKLNQFRNRVAHHEPIYHLDIALVHGDILDVIKWICLETHDWTKHHSTVNSIMRTSPSANGESKPHFRERCDTKFVIVNENSLLSNLAKTRFYVYKAYDSKESIVLEKQHLMDYLFSEVDHQDNTIMLDLSKITFKEIVDELKLSVNCQVCGATESLSKAKDILKQRNTNYILVNDQSGITGVIAKAHRQY